MEQIILIVHLLVALAIIGLIMLQQGKGADMGASFGSGASQTLFGSDGSGNALTRATSYLVVAFFATSFGLAMIATQKSASTSDFELDIPAAAMEQAPEDPAVSDLPVVNDDIPEPAAMTGAMPAEMVDDIPAIEVPQGDAAGGDVPKL
jgi:preprotein translocase subunit SecG